MAELENEGIIERIKSRGTFLAAEKVDHGLTLSIEGLYAQAQRLGKDLTSDVLTQEVAEASDSVMKALRLDSGAHVFLLERVRSVGQTVWSHTTTWMPANRVPGIVESDFSHGSLYDMLRTTYGMTFGRAERSLQAMAASADIAAYLKVEPGAPILQIKSTLFDASGVPVERFIAHHRGDSSRFDVVLGDEAHVAEVHVDPRDGL
ncbi:MAG: GntR family transcriptional regulator [Ancrocorticia sp.]|uniref:GntR family transcriptional regulator n=1 Tax=Ancrocorticia sp. TaxID=2593684 RepID=UPI003F8FB25C